MPADFDAVDRFFEVLVGQYFGLVLLSKWQGFFEAIFCQNILYSKRCCC